MSVPRVRLLLVALVAGAAAVSLLAVGLGSAGAPPAWSWSGLEDWYEALGPVPAVMHLVRGGAIVGALWLLSASALQLLASVSPVAWLGQLADGVSPRLLRQAAHLSVAVGLTVPSVAGPPTTDPPGTAVMEVLDATDDGLDATTTTSTSPVPPTAAPSTTTPTTTAGGPVSPPDAAPDDPPAPPAPARAEPGDELVVAVGDSFWSLASDVLAEAWGRPPSDREVHVYWRRLIEANRSRLVEPDNPDLLLPNQHLVRPSLT